MTSLKTDYSLYIYIFFMGPRFKYLDTPVRKQWLHCALEQYHFHPHKREHFLCSKGKFLSRKRNVPGTLGLTNSLAALEKNMTTSQQEYTSNTVAFIDP